MKNYGPVIKFAASAISMVLKTLDLGSIRESLTCLREVADKDEAAKVFVQAAGIQRVG